MTIKMTRRHALAAGAALAAIPGTALAQATTGDPTYVTGDVAMGADDAPLTVVEYASLTCPHCARFHIRTWPKVKEEYVDTGKVRFILREVYFDKYGLWASMTARCGGEKGFYPMMDTFLKTQSTWTKADDIGHAIQQIGRRAGLSQGQLSACLSDQDYAKTLVEAYQDNAEADAVRSTPTFIIGGKHHSGDMTFEDFAALLDAELQS
ncbi:MAG: DsbA family protein [Pseudomonadota bacterium]